MGFVAKKQREERPRRIRNTALVRQRTHSRPLFQGNSAILDSSFAWIGSIQAAGAHRGQASQGALKPAMEAQFFCCGIFTTWNLHVVIAASLELVIWEEPLIGPNQSNRRIN